MLYYSGNLGGGNPIPMNNYDISKQFKGTIFTSGLIREGTQNKGTKQMYWEKTGPGGEAKTQKYFENIAKGTTDPRVEFISQDHSSQLTNLEHITISESPISINFKISNKHQHLD